MVRGTHTVMWVIERLLARLPRAARDRGSSTVSVERNDALIDAALALAADSAVGQLDAVMRHVARRAAALTGAAAALALIDGEGQLERFAAHRADPCTRATITHPEP